MRIISGRELLRFCEILHDEAIEVLSGGESYSPKVASLLMALDREERNPNFRYRCPPPVRVMAAFVKGYQAVVKDQGDM